MCDATRMAVGWLLEAAALRDKAVTKSGVQHPVYMGRAFWREWIPCALVTWMRKTGLDEIVTCQVDNVCVSNALVTLQPLQPRAACHRPTTAFQQPL
jgi:hypothetical protein